MFGKHGLRGKSANLPRILLEPRYHQNGNYLAVVRVKDEKMGMGKWSRLPTVLLEAAQQTRLQTTARHDCG